MALDESLFGALWRGLRRLAGRPADEDHPGRVRTTDHEVRLRMLASLLAEAPLAVMVQDGPAGWSGRTVLLPATWQTAQTIETNGEIMLVATLHAVTARRLGLCLGPRPWPGGEAAGVLAALLAAPRVEAALLAELPTIGGLLARTHAACLADRPTPTGGAARALEALVALRLGGEPAAGTSATELAWARSAAACASEATGALLADLRRLGGSVTLRPIPTFGALREAEVVSPESLENDSKIATADDERPTTERTGKARTAVKRVPSPESPEDENPMVHSFEKVHTADDYAGGNKRVDGSDELAEHGDALDELALDQAIRSRVQTRSLYRADVLFTGDGGELAGETPLEGVAYDEWDGGRHRYRLGWCRVVSRVGQNAPGPQVAQRLRDVRSDRRLEIQRLRTELERLMLARRPRPRQLDGPEVDIDALVEHEGATRAGSSPEPRLYLSRRRSAPDVAVLVLLDTSLSTDAWVDNRRVLDVEVDTALVLGDATEGIFAEVAVAGFHSNTRRDCRFVGIKAFSEPWSTGHARLVGLQPTGYTRIGPAIRHGLALMHTAGARHRLMLVISDGRPTDYDRYEGRYGLADVRQATREAHREGVRVFGIGIDPRAQGPMGEMFGLGEYMVLHGPTDLPRALGDLFADLAR
jgi:hypothetical protein